MLKLWQKAAILIAVPLLFEVAFVGRLAWLLQEANQATRKAEEERGKEEASRMLLSQTEQFTKASQDAAVIILLYKSTHSQYFMDLYDKTLRAAQNHLDVLKQLTRDYPAERAKVYQAERMANEGIEIGTKLMSQISKGEDIDHLPQSQLMRTHMLLVSTRLARVLGELADAEQKRRALEQPHHVQLVPEQQRRDDLFRMLIYGISVNVAIAVFLAIFFNKGTTDRLRALMDNTERLKRGVALNPLLVGTDEIAELDKTFHQMAAALTEAARKERAIVDNALDVICSIDEGLLFKSLSPACQQVFGRESGELVGRSIESITVPEDISKVVESFAEIKKGPSKPFFESRISHKNGDIIDIRWSAHWAESEKWFFCVAHDITARKEVERLKQEFVSMMSHDLRTPLMSIEASLYLLSSGHRGELSPPAIKNITDAERNIAYIISLVNSLLDLERIDSDRLTLHKRSCDIGTLIDKAILSVKPLAEKKEIDLTGSGRDLEVLADADRVVQVIINLLWNALKFSPIRSSVQVTANSLEDQIRVEITDNGPGIPSGHLSKIFGRFEQVNASDASERGGSGLGLAICKSIIEAHAGTIGVDSREGKGSTFWFCLPRGTP